MASPDRISVRGSWYRHVRADGDPLGVAPAGAQGRWQRSTVVGAVYLADSPETAWAEFYRAAAEMQMGPNEWLPRDLWRFEVELTAVCDLASARTLVALGLPDVEPDRGQWPAFQDAGEALAADGAQGIRWCSAARPAHHSLCVFLTALGGLKPVKRTRVDVPPIPPRGMRT